MTDDFEDLIRSAGRGLADPVSTPTYHDAWRRGRRRRAVKRGAMALAGACVLVVAFSANLGRLPGSPTNEVDDIATGPLAGAATVTVEPAGDSLAADVDETSDDVPAADSGATNDDRGSREPGDGSPPADADPGAAPTPVTSTPEPTTASSDAGVTPEPQEPPPPTPPPASATAPPSDDPDVTSTPPAESPTPVVPTTEPIDDPEVDAAEEPTPGATPTPNEPAAAGTTPEPVATPDPTPDAVDAPPPDPEETPTTGPETLADVWRGPPLGLMADATIVGEIVDNMAPCVTYLGLDAKCELLPSYDCTTQDAARPDYIAVDLDGDGFEDRCVPFVDLTCDLDGDGLGDIACGLRVDPVQPEPADRAEPDNAVGEPDDRVGDTLVGPPTDLVVPGP